MNRADMAAALVAACIGFGSMYWLYRTFDNHKFITYRYRSGEGIRKQYLRRMKREEAYHVRPRGKNRTRTPCHMCPGSHPKPTAHAKTKLYEAEPWRHCAKRELRQLNAGKKATTQRDSFDMRHAMKEDLLDKAANLPKQAYKSTHRRVPVPLSKKKSFKKAMGKIIKEHFVNKTVNSTPIEVQWDEAPKNKFCGFSWLVNLTSNKPWVKLSHERVLFDSGANCCISPYKEDFVGEYIDCSKEHSVNGIGKMLNVVGRGHVAWTFEAENGTYRTIKVPCYHVPSSEIRILASNELLKAYPDETITITRDALTLNGTDDLPKLVINYCPSTSLPFAEPVSNPTEAPEPQVNKRTLQKYKIGTEPIRSLTESSNYNLTQPEKELLRWHYRLGHIGMRRVQWLFRRQALSTSQLSKQQQAAAAKLTSGPLCTACQYAKQRRNTEPGTRKQTVPDEKDALKREQLYPGQRVSIDHFHSSVHGRRLETFGREHVDEKYIGGAIFVDHATGYIDVQLQSKLNSHYTLAAKEAFESKCSEYGVVVQSYLTDNGTAFRNADFEAELKNFHQHIKHSSAGAHHSNGLAERGISTVMSLARAMLHHNALHWSDVCDTALWPLAVLHAVWIINHIPREDTGLSPAELFTKQKQPATKLQDLHVWGCPAYVLDKSIADGHKLPRWQPRSSRCMYVGVSPKHSSVAARVLNLSTGKITTQYHVIFDDDFQTVEANVNDLPDFDSEEWYNTFGATKWQYVDDDQEPLGNDHHGDYPDVMERAVLDHREEVRERKMNAQRNDAEDADEPPIMREHDPTSQPLPATTHSRSATEGATPPREGAAPSKATVEATDEDPWTYVGSTPSHRSPKRENEPTRTPGAWKAPSGWHDVEEILAPPRNRDKDVTPPEQQKPIQISPRRSRRLAHLDPEIVHITNYASKYASPQIHEEYHWERLYAYFATTISPPTEYHTQFAGAARKNKDPDTYSWEEAMASPYREQFLESAEVEVTELTEHDTWFEDLISNATTRIVPSQWVFRIKRTADGEIKKFKGRLVLRGDLQDYDGVEALDPGGIRILLLPPHGRLVPLQILLLRFRMTLVGLLWVETPLLHLSLSRTRKI